MWKSILFGFMNERVMPKRNYYLPVRFRGFTLAELIVMMVVIGILAIAVMPRFFDRQTFDARGFYDQVLSMVRYAQKAAISQHTAVFVNVVTASNKICLSYVVNTTCTLGSSGIVRNPVDQTFFSKTAPAGITFSTAAPVTTATFSFNALGQPVPNAVASIGIVGDGMTRTITIEQETGYVH